jgi:hypothetical protein
MPGAANVSADEGIVLLRLKCCVTLLSRYPLSCCEIAPFLPKAETRRGRTPNPDVNKDVNKHD